ncbi:TPA: hypothetical protein ACXRXT_005170 [Klebsiella pneumoniae]
MPLKRETRPLNLNINNKLSPLRDFYIIDRQTPSMFCALAPQLRCKRENMKTFKPFFMMFLIIGLKTLIHYYTVREIHHKKKAGIIMTTASVAPKILYVVFFVKVKEQAINEIARKRETGQ